MSNVKKLLKWLVPIFILTIAFAASWQIRNVSLSDEQVVCLLVQDIEKDNWKSIHYGMAEGLGTKLVRLNTYNYSHEFRSAAEAVNPCPLSTNLIVNGWHEDKFVPKGINGRLQIFGNSYEGHLIRPEFSIGNFFAPEQKAKLIVDYINRQNNTEDHVSIALALGPENLIASQKLTQAFRNQLRDFPHIRLETVKYSTDSKFQQYLAMTSLLIEQAHIDYVIGTPTAIEQGSKIIEGRELQSSNLIALTPSRQIVNLLEKGKIEAVIDDKPILQGKWLASWVLQSESKTVPEPDFTIDLVTKGAAQQVSETDTFVPYGYRVIYNTGNY